jgi:hypothetical protein
MPCLYIGRKKKRLLEHFRPNNRFLYAIENLKTKYEKEYLSAYEYDGKVSERDSSGTTVAGETREGDGADSPTRGARSATKRLAQIIGIILISIILIY